MQRHTTIIWLERRPKVNHHISTVHKEFFGLGRRFKGLVGVESGLGIIGGGDEEGKAGGIIEVSGEKLKQPIISNVRIMIVITRLNNIQQL